MRHRARAWGDKHRARALLEYQAQRRRVRASVLRSAAARSASGVTNTGSPGATTTLRAAELGVAAPAHKSGGNAGHVGAPQRPPRPDATSYAAFQPPDTDPLLHSGRGGARGSRPSAAQRERVPPDGRDDGLLSQRAAVAVVALVAAVVVVALLGGPATWAAWASGLSASQAVGSQAEAAAAPPSREAQQRDVQARATTPTPRGLVDWRPHPTRPDEVEAVPAVDDKQRVEDSAFCRAV